MVVAHPSASVARGRKLVTTRRRGAVTGRIHAGRRKGRSRPAGASDLAVVGPCRCGILGQFERS